MKLLLVENEQDCIRSVAKALIEDDVVLVQTPSASAALRHLRKDSRFGLIILGSDLKKEGGFEFLARVKGSSEFAHIPIIVCNASSDSPTVAKAIEQGAKGFVVKPIAVDLFRSKVRELLDKHSRTVLVVDDEEIIRELLTSMIGRAGYFCLSASDGVEALQIMEENKVDAVITDVMMPKMDGLELLENIKDKNSDLPVMLITGRRNRKMLDRINQISADGLIFKPFQNVEVLERLARLTR